MKKIVWAIDPYNNSLSQLVAQARYLDAWFGYDSAPEIEPVFVLTPGVRVIPFGWFKDLLPELKQEANEKLKTLRKATCGLSVGMPKLLVHPSDHVENIARVLLNYAGQEKADLIVLRTQGRKGLARVILGSLAEALVKGRAGQPVLVLKPETDLVASARFRSKERHDSMRMSEERQLTRVA